MKRWAAALLAVLFLSTATLHILCHADLSEASCTVCHVQQAGSTGAAAPSVVSSPPRSVVLAKPVPTRVRSAFVVALSARAPPASPVSI